MDHRPEMKFPSSFIKHFFFVLAILFLISCESEVEVPVPDTDIPIIVNAIFSPDSLMKVKVYRAVGFFDKSQPFWRIKNATVRAASASGNESEFHYENDAYVSDTHPDFGKTYKLTVTVPGYPNTAEAVTVMPGQKPDFHVSGFRVDTSDPDRQGNLYADLSIKDPPDEVNYYSISVVEEMLVYETDRSSQDFKLIVTDTVYTITPVSIISENIKNNYYTDNYEDNRFNKYFSDPDSIVKIRVANYHITDNLGHELPMYLTVRFIVNEINADYYQYVRSTSANSNYYNDLFAGPVRAYSDITNGTGIFAAVTEADTLLDHPDKKILENNTGQ